MKHLMRYEGFSSSERLDEILDKISKYGMASLTDSEKKFLDSHKEGTEQETHKELAKEELEKVFVDDSGYFKFEWEETEDYGDEIHYIGTLYVPDLEITGGKKIEGRLGGRIVKFESGQISPDFYSLQKEPGTEEHYDVFEFCNGLEYELDSFLDYVVSELEEKNPD